MIKKKICKKRNNVTNNSLHLPIIKDSKKVLISMVYKKACELYGYELPKIVECRIEEELYGKDKKAGILGLGYETIYLIFEKLTNYSKRLGYSTLPRGGVASSLVAYLLGITNVNPLPPHYLCPNCKTCIFKDDVKFPLDMDDKCCLKCGTKMLKLGFNISYETFLGYNAQKLPDIDVNFAPEVRDKIFEYLMKEFSLNEFYRAGVTKTLENGKVMHGIHPGGVLVVPNTCNILDYTQVWYGDEAKTKAITEMDYHDLLDKFVKIDILTHSILSKVKEVEDRTGVKVSDMEIDDSFWPVIKSNILDCEFLVDSKFQEEVKRRDIKNFEDFLKVFGISHSEGLIDNEVVYCYDDIMDYLIDKGMNRKDAYSIMMFVKERKVNKEPWKWKKYVDKMMELSVDDWFVSLCEQVKFMLSKAHIVSYTICYLYLLRYGE